MKQRLKFGLMAFVVFLISADIASQSLKERIDFQFNIGSTFTLPLTNTAKQWPDIIGTPEVKYTAKIGYYTEFNLSYKVFKKYSVITGLSLNYKAFNKIDYMGYITNEGNFVGYWMSLPLLLDYRVSETLPLHIAIGPSLNYLFYAKEEGTTTFASPIELPQNDYSYKIKKQEMDVAIALRLAYDIKLSEKMTGVITGKYEYQFSNSFQTEDVHILSGWDKVFTSIGFGVKF